MTQDNCNRKIGPIGAIPQFDIPPDLMPSFEDIFCLLTIFLFDKLVYPIAEKMKLPLFPLRRIALGFVFITASFGMAGFLQLVVQGSNEPIHVLWQIPQIFFMACAEITVIVDGFCDTDNHRLQFQVWILRTHRAQLGHETH